ncbi:hypothetical protein PBRA_005411 [Plasmodiophora brassicae]|uniref:Uncharacterized protein n=1 Tax=Plasmodiophora brassicae TaxID=37360 RepID=A0A0G4INS2_PLABS|nr:hypothetical protein PBRA_005411 [Plasmodiophora brassicae]
MGHPRSATRIAITTCLVSLQLLHCVVKPEQQDIRVTVDPRQGTRVDLFRFDDDLLESFHKERAVSRGLTNGRLPKSVSDTLEQLFHTGTGADEGAGFQEPEWFFGAYDDDDDFHRLVRQRSTASRLGNTDQDAYVRVVSQAERKVDARIAVVEMVMRSFLPEFRATGRMLQDIDLVWDAITYGSPPSWWCSYVSWLCPSTWSTDRAKRRLLDQVGHSPRLFHHMMLSATSFWNTVDRILRIQPKFRDTLRRRFKDRPNYPVSLFQDAWPTEIYRVTTRPVHIQSNNVSIPVHRLQRKPHDLFACLTKVSQNCPASTFMTAFLEKLANECLQDTLKCRFEHDHY